MSRNTKVLVHKILRVKDYSNRDRILSGIFQSDPEYAKHWFTKMDENVDGQVSKSEFFSKFNYTLPRGCLQTNDKKDPTAQQYRRLFIYAGLPFVGFGFVDNFIMLCCGNIIETKLGFLFGISTLGAAGLGNTISDVAGLGLGNVIQKMALKMGLPSPQLSTHQLQLKKTKRITLAGSVTGISLGCVLGMCPLLI